MKYKLNQNQTPLFTAMKEYRDRQVTPFDVPGHKHGRGLKEYKDYFGDAMLELDVNSMKPLDFLGNPTSVIKESEELLADAFGGDRGFFIINGTSFAVQTMIMSVVKHGEKIILPRNVHKSVINALVLSGALPVYMKPEMDSEMGVSHNVTLKALKKAYEQNPDSKAALFINPTYYGAAGDLRSLVKFCRDRGIYSLVDEAHGTHFHFHPDLPVSGMEAGADFSAVSLHKTGGSLTQSSALIINTKRIGGQYVRRFINLMQTTSPSYLLMGSVDVARKQLALHGKEMLDEVLALSHCARSGINSIKGVYSMGPEAVGRPGVYHFDPTKLSITMRNLGINGMELYDRLRDEYNIQMETGDVYSSLAILSLGDSMESVDHLIRSIEDIKQRYGKNHRLEYDKIDLNYPDVVLTPREAFYGEKERVSLSDSLGRISGETIMSYPPGIPVVGYGERITESVIEQILLFKSSHGIITGMDDPEVSHLKVLKAPVLKKRR